MKLRIALALASITSSTAATAADWWFVASSGENPNQQAVFVDASSVSGTSTIRNIWQFIVLQSAEKDGVRKKKNLFSYNCTERTYRIISYTHYGNNDRFIDSFTAPSYSRDWEYVVPESRGESVWKFVCEGPSANHFQLKSQTPEQFSAMYFKL